MRRPTFCLRRAAVPVVPPSSRRCSVQLKFRDGREEQLVIHAPVGQVSQIVNWSMQSGQPFLIESPDGITMPVDSRELVLAVYEPLAPTPSPGSPVPAGLDV